MYCNASASPPITAISWQTNTTGLSGNRHSGGTLASPSLTIYNVEGGDNGWYTCTGTNAVGTGRSQSVFLNVTGEDICSVDVFPSTTNADTLCTVYSELVCRVTCNEGYITRQGNESVYFKCENNIWQPVLPPNGCIDYVFPKVEFKIRVTYTLTQVAAFCLDSHTSVIQKYNATFAQQASVLCNNEFVTIGTLVITDMESTTSSFSILTTYTLSSPFNMGSSGDKQFCEILLNTRLTSSAIFTYTDMLSCDTGTASVSRTDGLVMSAIDVCPAGSSSVVTSKQTYCVSDKPSVIITKPLYVVEKGDSFTLGCFVESTTEILGVYWRHNNSGIVSMIYGNLTTRYRGSLPNNPSLTVLSADFLDQGSYTCMAYNGVGSGTSTSSTVNVIEKIRDVPTVSSLQTELKFSIGDSIILPCSVNDNSEPSAIFWQKSRHGQTTTIQPFGINARFTGSLISNPSLSIDGLNQEDEGNYTCFAVNILGVGQGNAVQLILDKEDFEEIPFTGKSTVETSLTCVRTFLFLLVFGFTGILLCTSVAVLIYQLRSQTKYAIIENIRNWRISEKISVIALEIYFSVLTACALAGIVSVVECSNNYTGATTALTSVAMIPGAVISACYLSFCCYIQSKRVNKIAASDSKERISTSPTPEQHSPVKSWRGYQPSEPLNVQDEIESPVTTFDADNTNVYASTFRTLPLISKPSGSHTRGKKSLPSIGYTEYSEEKRKRHKRRKKRKKETFDTFYEENL